MPTFEASPATSEQQLTDQGALRTLYLDNSFESVNLLIRSHTASRTPIDDNLGDDYNTNDSTIKLNEPQTLDDLAVPLSKLELLEEQKYNQFRQVILATKASDLTSSFFEANNALFRCQHPPISGIQVNFITNCLRG